MPLSHFHPAVANWFARNFEAPTPAQVRAWAAIRAGQDALIAAPTGSGKTLAAFLAALDDLVRAGLAGELTDQTRVVYVSPLKALSNDIHRNLEVPLSGIGVELAVLGLPAQDIRSFVRSGDTPQRERAGMRRRAPHIVVTTPESLYILLGSESGRQMLANTRSVIVDEIHALAPNKRGVHLALSLERLETLAGRRPARIGLSATQKPIEEVARFLVGSRRLRADGTAACALIDTGHARTRDLALEVPAGPLEAVMSGEVWEQTYDRLSALIHGHRTTLVFVNTRRMAERVARHLSERIGAESVTAHHGSMARESRLDAEQRLKRGELRALVATASLELGIDIGEVDLVCQLGSPRSISAFLQRVGRSGHALGGTPKGRLFPLSRDDLAECAALLDCVRRGELDLLRVPVAPLDVLAQQVVAEVAAREWRQDALYDCLRGAWPYRDLTRPEYDEIVRMLAEGYSTRRGRRAALLHQDAVGGMLRARRGARLTALTCGGTIPDTADYQVILEPEDQRVGTVNEDFAIESLAGDVFQLGNSAYRMLRIERGTVRVQDAKGAAPNIPFWIGEAPGRSDALSFGVARLHHEITAHLARGSDNALRWLSDDLHLAPAAAQQLADYLSAAYRALGALPTQAAVILERFFDETGGAHLVVHSPYGSRINRAWGLSLRKRFCRKFNFELQAAATENSILLSLTHAHSFPLDEVRGYLRAATVREVLVQALLAAPMFLTRWRLDAAVALALPRFRGGRKVPPQLQRMEAEDLVAAVFPDQLACAENLAGDREVPDHPLVRQTIRDCLEDAMDIDGLVRLLRGIESGAVQVLTRDVTEPSPLAVEVLSARPYAFLDDAPLEERRAQAVTARRWLDPQSAADIGRLDPEAIARVRQEAWPDAETADELHDALLWLGGLSDAEAQAKPAWRALLDALARAGRATRLTLPQQAVNAPTRGAGRPDIEPAPAPANAALWIAAERLPLLRALHPHAAIAPQIEVPAAFTRKAWPREDALRELVRGRLEGLGPVCAATLAATLAVPVAAIDAALAGLEAEGFAMRGRYTAQAGDKEWCERRLLARIHRYTVNRLRAEIEPVSARELLRFLFEWQRLAAEARMEGPDSVAAVVAQLEGFEAPAAAWETEILPARIADYEPRWLDDQCLAGRVAWLRLAARQGDPERGAAPIRSTPIVLLTRKHARLWAAPAGTPAQTQLSTRAQAVMESLRASGASFFDELVESSGLLRAQVEEALAELVALGQVSADSFAGLRALLVPSDRRKPYGGGRRKRRSAVFGMEDAGRWTLARRSATPDTLGFSAEAVEHIARSLLRRWGVVFWRLMAREADWLPPWQDLLRCWRRLEARGEIRGGRFVAGFSGEQFALPEAIGLLREVRRKPPGQALLSLSGADPLNLVGLLTPDKRLPALTANRVLYRDAIAIAVFAGGEVHFLEELAPAERWRAQNALLRRHVPAALADFS